MKSFLLKYLIFTLIACALGNEEFKVKIGIKKRVENCPAKTKKGDFIHVHYKGTLEDGHEFDSSYPRGHPFTFTLGSNQVIKGWNQGLLGMCEGEKFHCRMHHRIYEFLAGEKRRLVIPSELGYGKHATGTHIPPDSTLFFDVELIKIEKRSDL